MEFLLPQANTISPSDEELTECSERSQSGGEESEANTFVYQTISQLIPQVGKDWDEDDETDWLRGIPITQIQDDPDNDYIPPKPSPREEDGSELSNTEVEMGMDPIPGTDDIGSQISEDDQEEEEEYFGDDEKEGPKGSKFLKTVKEIGPFPNMKPEDLAPQIEKNDDEKDSMKSTEIVLNPEYLNLSESTQPSPSSLRSQIPLSTPRLSRRQSLSDKIVQTLQRSFPTPGKNVENTHKVNKKSKKENIKIILF